MSQFYYKGFVINATPLRTNDGKWVTHICISKDYGSHVNEKCCDDVQIFDTEAETIKNCFEFGKKIIDGQDNNYSITDL